MAIINGTNGAETLYGTSVGDQISGLGGNDIIWASSGNDVVYGGDGKDYLYGEDDDDYLYGEAGADRLYGGNGNDYLYGGDGLGADLLEGGAGNDYLNGGTGSQDVVSYKYSPSGVVVNLVLGTASDGYGGTDTIVNVEGVNGSLYSDIITGGNWAGGYDGDDGDDIIYAGGGADVISGGFTLNSGNDELYGEDGNDLLLADAGDDLLDGGADIDTVSFLQVWGSVINLATGTATDGLGGTDTLISIENIVGSPLDDIVIGDGNDNDLQLNDGNDIVYGGDGLDTLTGGLGSDTFVFEAASAFNDIDVVRDFSVAQNDKIDLSDLLTAYNPLTDLITDFIEITTVGVNSILKVDLDGAGTTHAMAQIAQLSNVTGLTDEAALVASGNIVV